MATSTLNTFPQMAQDLGKIIDVKLAEAIRFDEGCPAPLRNAISDSLLSPGKRLRPILVLLAAEACGSSYEAAMPAACAAEMIHAYSLIHDDLPAMDDDDLRRGRPTCHRVYGEATAILSGDALLTRAFGLMAEELADGAVAARCCAALSRAAGAEGMVGGQADDLDAEQWADLREKYDEQQTAECLETLESIHRRKTGAMFNVSLELGALVAQASEAEAAALAVYGSRLGLAFQIVDDLLDVSGDEAAMGKRVQKDSEQGKLTYPGLLGVEESRKRARQLVQEACDALAPLAPRAQRLEALARFVAERNR